MATTFRNEMTRLYCPSNSSTCETPETHETYELVLRKRHDEHIWTLVAQPLLAILVVNLEVVEVDPGLEPRYNQCIQNDRNHF